jgi:hypothetical protein
LGIFPERNISVNDKVLVYFKGELGSQFYCRVRGADANQTDYETCQSPYTILPKSALGRQLTVDLAAVDNAGNVFEASAEVKLGSGSYYPSYSDRLESYNKTTLSQLPEACEDHKDLFAAVAIAGFALFAILAVIFPLIIMSRM